MHFGFPDVDVPRADAVVVAFHLDPAADFDVDCASGVNAGVDVSVDVDAAPHVETRTFATHSGKNIAPMSLAAAGVAPLLSPATPRCLSGWRRPHPLSDVNPTSACKGKGLI